MATVLLIEDDELVRYSLNRVLTAAGHQVVEAVNGVQGLKQFKTIKPDLVLTDIVMPEQDGLGCLSAIRLLDKSVPVLAMSGGGGKLGYDFLLVAEAMGANAIIAKPFDNQVLLNKVAELLER